jgi:hypothetical protein
MDKLEQYKAIQKEALYLFINKDESLSDFGKVIDKIGDKINNIDSVERSMRDTLLDLHNYTVRAIMLMDDQKVELDNQEMSYVHEMSYDDEMSYSNKEDL